MKTPRDRYTISFLLIPMVASLIAFTSRADVAIVTGEVSGTWSADSLLVASDITIPSGSSLTIDPGVNVIFIGSFRFDVDAGAELHAVGTQIEPIVIESFQDATPFVAMFFNHASDTSILEYCEVRDALWGAVRLDGAAITIRHCLFEGNTTASGSLAGGAIAALNGSDALIEQNVFRNNEASNRGGAIYCNASAPTIRDNTFLNNECGNASYAHGGAISCTNGSSATITGNTFTGNVANPGQVLDPQTGRGGAIHCADGSNALIAHNVFLENRVDPAVSGSFCGGGALFVDSASPHIEGNLFIGNRSESYDGGAIYLFNTAATIVNNTFYRNYALWEGGAIYIRLAGSPVIKNCILRLDSGEEIAVSSASPEVTYCNVQGGWPGTGNIDADPLFRDPAALDYHLQDAVDCGDPDISPCIDAGDPVLADAQLACDRGLRTARSDMGAYGGGALMATPVEQEGVVAGGRMALRIYPNPVQGAASVAYLLPHAAAVQLSLYDVAGRRVRSLERGVESAGWHQLSVDLRGLPSGVYWYRLRAGAREGNRRIVVLH